MTRDEVSQQEKQVGQYTQNYTWDVVAYYVQAVCLKEQLHIPIIGPSVDRKMLALMHKALNSKTVKSYVCFACSGVYTSVEQWSRALKSSLDCVLGSLKAPRTGETSRFCACDNVMPSEVGKLRDLAVETGRMM